MNPSFIHKSCSSQTPIDVEDVNVGHFDLEHPLKPITARHASQKFTIALDYSSS